MKYVFKSRATADVIMLEADARRLLEIMGKSAGPQGIITVDQIPGAVSALEAAIGSDSKQNSRNHDAFAVENHADDAERQHVGLHQRAAPLIHILKEAAAAGKDVVWGV